MAGALRVAEAPGVGFHIGIVTPRSTKIGSRTTNRGMGRTSDTTWSSAASYGNGQQIANLLGISQRRQGDNSNAADQEANHHGPSSGSSSGHSTVINQFTALGYPWHLLAEGSQHAIIVGGNSLECEAHVAFHFRSLFG